MLSEIHRICDAYKYVPVLTEIQGLYYIALGTVCLGLSGILKVNEIYTGRKETLYPITNDAASFNAECGLVILKQGVKQILPATGLVVAIYAIGNKLLV